MKLSVVILNFNRPAYIVNNIIPSIKDHVDEILISHGKQETYFNNKYCVSLKHYGEINDNYGLSRRFLSCLEAKNEYVMIMDDDIIPSKETIQFLYNKIRKESSRIHGIYGRDLRNGYTTENCFGEVSVVLTRCLVTTKSMCKYYMENFRNFESDLVKSSKPFWNGEDILFSLLSIERYGILPIAYDLKHTNKWTNYLNFSTSISLDDSHLKYRKKISSEIINKLNIEDSIKNKTNIKFKKEAISYFIKNSNLIYIIPPVLIILLYLVKKRFF